MRNIDLTVAKLKDLYLHQSGKVAIAISGGADSVALLHLCLAAGLRPALLHVNYNLRADESQADEHFVRQLARLHGLELHILRVKDTFWQKHNGHGKSTQQLARQVRYKWLLRVALIHQYKTILVGHQLDDQLETMFINLRRGTGIAGLSGIRATTVLDENNGVRIERPLLHLSKNELTDYLNSKGISWREDSSNQTDNYLRNKVRHHLVEPFKQLGSSNWQQVASRTIEQLKFEQSVLEQARLVFEKRFSKFEHVLLQSEVCYTYASASEKQELAEQIPFLRRLLNLAGMTAKSQDEALIRFKQELESKAYYFSREGSWLKVKSDEVQDYIPQAGSWRTATHLVVLDRQRLFITPHKSLEVQGLTGLPAYRFKLEVVNHNQEWKVRLPQNGDKFKPYKGQGTLSIQDALQQAGIAKHHKNIWPIIIDEDNEILWLINVRMANHQVVHDALASGSWPKWVSIEK